MDFAASSLGCRTVHTRICKILRRSLYQKSAPLEHAGGPHMRALAAWTTAVAPSQGGAYRFCMSHFSGCLENSFESL